VRQLEEERRRGSALTQELDAMRVCVESLKSVEAELRRSDAELENRRLEIDSLRRSLLEAEAKALEWQERADSVMDELDQTSGKGALMPAPANGRWKLRTEQEAARQREQDRREAEVATEQARLEAEAGTEDACFFYFIPAAKLRVPLAELPFEDRLPTFSALRAMDGWLERKPIRATEAYRGAYQTSYLAVSHRAPPPAEPYDCATGRWL
jgi:hypothetical protein